VDGSEYGPVVANDTAWSIAKKVRPGGVSMEQMMMALLEANPHAFVNGNINRLRKGQILRVPALSEIQELSRQQARQAYREQQDQWLARRNEKLQSAAQTESADQAPADSGTGAADPNDQLRIATARPTGEGEAGAGDDDAVSPAASDIKSRLIVARENAETSRQEAETLRTQVDDLQVRLENMQKLLSLKDDQLAQFQDRLVTDESAVTETATEMQPETVAPVGETVEQAEVVVTEEEAVATPEEAIEAVAMEEDYRIEDIAPQIDPDAIVLGAGLEESQTLEATPQTDPELIVEGAAAEAVIEAAADEIVVGQDAGDAEIVIEGEPAAESLTPVAPADSVVTAVEAPSEPAPSDQEPATADPVPVNPIMRMVEQNIVPVAVGGVSLLALLGWLATRGRRKKEETEPLLAGAGAGAVAETAVVEPEVPAVDEPGLDSEALSDLPDSSFLDEFSPSDINSLQDETGEVDPVSEADVYIAYGRYQQAEEMLQQAMSRDPDRLALKHKLLEVHYATRNAGAFAALAQEMVDSGQDTVDEAAWTRAQDMGRELAPENSLFALNEDASLDEEVAGADETAQALAATATPVDDDTLALDDLELSELTSEFDEESRSEDDFDAPSEVSITLDLDEPSGLVNAIAEPELPEPIKLDELEALDVDLPKVEVESASSESADTISDSLDLDSMMAEAEAAVDIEDSTLGLDSEFSADELQAQLDELSDLSVVDGNAAKDAVEPPASLGLVQEDSGFVAPEGLDQPLNLDTAFDTASGEDGGADVLDMGDVAAPPAAEPVDEEEVATKLDLARAYVEMGDEDGARAILEEVVAEGTQSQRGDAETLLSNLA
jgi:pilus assembly protein FimV